METIIDFQRYRSEGQLFWNWNVLGDDTRGANGFDSLEDAVEAFFDDEGHEDVILAFGVAFPDGYDPLQGLTDDVYRIIKTEE